MRKKIGLILNSLAWNRTVLNSNCVLMLTEFFEIKLFICMKMDLALNNLQWLICHKTKPNQTIIRLCVSITAVLLQRWIIGLNNPTNADMPLNKETNQLHRSGKFTLRSSWHCFWYFDDFMTNKIFQLVSCLMPIFKDLISLVKFYGILTIVGYLMPNRL